MTIALLAVLALAAFRVAGLLIRPWRHCPACGGSGRHGWSRAGAWGPCGRCHGTRKLPRPGARLACRVILRRELE